MYITKLITVKIIGITGTLGAGKGTIVDYILQNKDFAYFSVRSYLIDQLKSRNLEVNRDTMTQLANELRATHHPAFVVEELYNIAKQNGKNCIIESIRTPGEIQMLKKNDDFYLFAVDADPKIRYERIVIRNSETDKIDFDTFIQNEKREMNTDDPNKQNLSKCLEMADFVFTNNGSLDALQKDVDKVLQKIL